MKNTIAERIFDFLKDFPPFDVLEKNQLFKIASNIKVTYLEENTFIFKEEAHPHNCFYVVKDGAIGLYRTMGEDQILVDICDEGDLFGLRPIIQNDHYLMSAKANEESILYAIPVEILQEIIKTNTKAHKYIIASFSSNIKTPYAVTTNSNLFANVDSLEKTNKFSEVQTAQYSKNPVTCLPTATIKEAANIMSSKRVGSILIVEDQKPIGIITDKDLRLKIATGLISIEEKVGAIMSFPVITFPEKITVAEAQIALLKHKVSHICITKDGTDKSELVGILAEHDLNILQTNNPMFLVREIKYAQDAETLKHIRTKASELTMGYLEQEIPIYFITKVITEINIAITKRIIRLTIKELGQDPPVAYAWLAMGSQGRSEQLLMTDQDNALVFENVEDEDYERVKEYFIKFSTLITQKLNIVGFEYCPANIMASNSKWCLSLKEWKAQFKDWVKHPTSDKILLSIIFFDFEYIFGDKELYNQMSESVFRYISKKQTFLGFLSKATLDNPPPLGFFKQFLVEQDGENKDHFDIKSRAIRPLVDAARIFSLHHSLKVNNTIARYEKLMEVEPQNSDIFESCVNAFKMRINYKICFCIKAC